MAPRDLIDASTSKPFLILDGGTAQGTARRLVLQKFVPEPRAVLKMSMRQCKYDMLAEFRQDVEDDRNAFNHPHKHVCFELFNEHHSKSIKRRFCEGVVGNTYFRKTVRKETKQSWPIQHVVEQLDKVKAGEKRTSFSKQYSSCNSSPSRCTLLISSFCGSSAGISSSGIVNASNVDHARATTELDRIHRLFQTDLRDQRNATRAGRSTTTPSSSSPKRERIQRSFEDDLHQIKLKLKRERYLQLLQGHSCQSLKEAGLHPFAEDIKNRIQKLNERVTRQLGKHTEGMKIRSTKNEHG